MSDLFDEISRMFAGNEDLLRQVEASLDAIDPIRMRSEELIREVNIVRFYRDAMAMGDVVPDRYLSDVQRLTENKALMGKLDTHLRQYQSSWTSFPLRATGANHRERVESIAYRHPKAKKMKQVAPKDILLPMALVMDIANRSDVGIYTQEQAAVRTIEQGGSQFQTLAHSPYWRDRMALHGIRMAERFGGSQFDLVMVGDGSGDLGASMAHELQRHGVNYRLLHMDIGDGHLRQQRERYLEAGIDANRIITVKGSVTEAGKALRKVPGYRGGFFVLHEVFDALRTHSLNIDAQGMSEDHMFLSPNYAPSITSIITREPLFDNLLQYFPWYSHRNNIGGGQKHVPFTPEILIAIKEIMKSADKVALYAGDYSGAFALDAYTRQAHRTYGHAAASQQDYLRFLEQPVDITADVPAAFMGVAHAYGGKVEFAGPQAEFLGQVDDSLMPTLAARLDEIEAHARRRYRDEEARELIDDSLFVTEIANPTMFAAIATKGL